MDQWYVWLVGCPRESGSWGVIGLFSSREKAEAAASSGCFITILPMDEAAAFHGELTVTWVD